MMDKMVKSGGKENKIRIIVIGAIAILVLIAAIIFFVVNRPEEETKRNIVVTKDNAFPVCLLVRLFFQCWGLFHSLKYLEMRLLGMLIMRLHLGWYLQ